MRIADELLGMFRRKPEAPPEATDKPATVGREEHHEELPQFKVNPFINAFMRLSGEWPLIGPPPLSVGQYRRLFAAAPAFADYFPVVDYLDEEEAYLFDDGLNVARFWEVSPRYMCARSDDALARFNEAITAALNALPADEEYPYIAQIYVKAREADAIADDLHAAMVENGVADDPYSQAILEVNRHHAELISHPKGIFPDSRLTGSDKGWRVNDQTVYLCIYRRCPDKFWKKNKRSPAAQNKYDLTAFETAMQNAGIRLRSLLPHELVNWLGPYFSSNRVDVTTMQDARQMANFDLGQMIFRRQPSYYKSDDPRERGIWRFGDGWMRYLTVSAVMRPPRDGAMTLGEQHTEGKEAKIDAALFEQLPQGAMMSYTIIPQSDTKMKGEINAMLYEAQKGASREAQFANKQADAALDAMLHFNQRIFYTQLGIFLRSDSLDELLDATEQTMSRVKASGCIDIIEPRYDLISQDSFVRALPTVYDFGHDRNAALRARKTFTSHIASLLPFYGNRSGSRHPCYIMYSRTGEPFYLNPFHRDDRERVSHEVFFGPTGSGKSATIVYMAMQSMAVNNPRQFIFDYGNSFGLMADYMAKHGKKVKRFILHPNSKDVVAPFFETQKALLEAEEAQRISDGYSWASKTEDKKEAEARLSLVKKGGRPEAILLADDAAATGVNTDGPGTATPQKGSVMPLADVAATTGTTGTAGQETDAAEGAQIAPTIEAIDNSFDDEKRSYLSEMEFIMRIMITGGSAQELSQAEIARINRALVRGLKLSVERGEPHARPVHMMEAMRAMATEEMQRPGGQQSAAENMSNMADALERWTQGTNGRLFNRHADGFSEDYDLTVIELGALGQLGGGEMLAVAGLSAIYTITALAEKLQHSGRSIEVKIDEAHLWAKVKLLMSGLVVGSKVFRKLNTWLTLITQDVSDFKDDAAKILTNAEFWWLMRMSATEIEQATKILNLNEEVKHLIRFPRKEERRFVEGISLSGKFPETLVRYVPPSLMLALGQTDGKEKEHRAKLMQKHGINELEAALMVAEEIDVARRAYQEQAT